MNGVKQKMSQEGEECTYRKFPATEGISWAEYVCSKWRSDYRGKTRRTCVSCHKDANATGSCAALCLPLLSMIVVSRWHDAKFSPTFINSRQRAAPEFPMIPPVLRVILLHLSLFARSNSVLLMVEILTLFFVLYTLDTALIFPACVTEHHVCYVCVCGGGNVGDAVDNYIISKKDELKGHFNGIFRLTSTTLNYKEWVTCTFHTGFPGKPGHSWLTPDVKKHTWIQETYKYLKEIIKTYVAKGHTNQNLASTNWMFAEWPLFIGFLCSEHKLKS